MGKVANGIGNVLWMIFGGLIMTITNFLKGIVLCCTIIFIPIGIQMFKVAKFAFLPMGKKVVKANCGGFKTFLNFVWAILLGWEQFLIYGLVGIIFCITIVGIPFGRQYFKLAKFILLPLGHTFAAMSPEEIEAEKRKKSKK